MTSWNIYILEAPEKGSFMQFMRNSVSLNTIFLLSFFFWLLSSACDAKTEVKAKINTDYKVVSLTAKQSAVKLFSKLIRKSDSDTSLNVVVEKGCSYKVALKLTNYLLYKNKNKKKIFIHVYRFSNRIFRKKGKKYFFRDPFSSKNNAFRIASGYITDDKKMISWIIKNGKPQKAKYIK